MTQVSLQFLYGVLRSTLLVYITLVALHFMLEVLFAHRAYRRSLRGYPEPETLPSVDVVVPCYKYGHFLSEYVPKRDLEPEALAHHKMVSEEQVRVLYRGTGKQPYRA